MSDIAVSEDHMSKDRPSTAEEKHEDEATEKDVSEMANETSAALEEPAAHELPADAVKEEQPAANDPQKSADGSANEHTDEAKDEVPPLNEGMQ